MPKFIVYETWTRNRIVEAKDASEFYERELAMPTDPTMTLSKWHVVPVKEEETQQG